MPLPIHLPRMLLLAAIALTGTAGHAQPAGSQGEDFIYRVRAGDTLGELATTYTRQGNLWTQLQSLNKVADPYALPIGQELRIPLALIPRSAATATVAHVSGSAQADGQALQVGASLGQGTTVSTAQDGYVTLELADGSKLTVPAASRIELEHLQTFEGTGLTDAILGVRQGSVESLVAPDGRGVGRFEIRTPVAVTGVRGTRFRVRTEAGAVHSEVLEGSVRLAAAGAPSARPIQVGSGYGANVDAQGRPGAVHSLLAAPQLPSAPQQASGSWQLRFAPIPGAVGYMARVTHDAQASRPVSTTTVATPELRVVAPGPGTWYVQVWGVDASGMYGRDTIAPFLGGAFLNASAGDPVGLGSGGSVQLNSY